MGNLKQTVWVHQHQDGRFDPYIMLFHPIAIILPVFIESFLQAQYAWSTHLHSPFFHMEIEALGTNYYLL